MPNSQNTLESLILELKIIQLQLHLAKRSAKKTQTLRSALMEVESHVNHSISSLNHLITRVNDFKTRADLKTAKNNKQRKRHENNELPPTDGNGEYQGG